VPRLLRSGAALRCQGSAWRYTRHACEQFASLKKVKVELALCTLRWLCHDDVRPTQSNKWPSVWRIGRASEDSRGKCFGTANVFRIFPFYVSVVDGSC
jgi:hypothetical protein